MVPFRGPCNRRHACASLAKAVRCYRLYGDIMVNLRRTGNCLARERAASNEVMKNRSVTPNLTLSNTREPFHRARPQLRSVYEGS